MTDLKSLFRQAVAASSDTRGKPAVLGKADDTLYWVDPAGSTRRDRVWARIGESASNQEVVVRCTAVSPQLDMPVRVDMVNGVLAVTAVDETRYLDFSGNRPGGSVSAHAWLHGRLGPDPFYPAGLQFLPLLVHPTSPADMTVTVEQAAYRWNGTLSVFETAASSSLSGYVPGSSANKHFVIVCLDRDNNSIAITDGADISAAGSDVLFGGGVVTVADVTAVSVPAAYYPLAVVLLYYGQTSIRAADVVMDLRLWGGEARKTAAMVLTAAAGWPTTTSGCAAAAQTEFATNGVDLVTLDFDQTTIEHAQWTQLLPPDYDGGTVTFQVVWTAAGGTTAETVEWNLQGRAYADNDPIDAAWGTTVEVSDPLIAAGDIHISDESAAVTLAGSPAGGQLVQFRLWRDAANDTLAADARLISVNISYTAL